MHQFIGRVKGKVQQGSTVLAGLCFMPAVHASDWFPKALVNNMADNKDAMTIFADILKKGFTILLFVLCLVTFFKFVTTVSHGIEEAKKNEGGLLAVFSSYAIMAFIFLTISLVCGYLGFNVVSKFSVSG